MSALKWSGLGLALLATAALCGYFSMKSAVRGGEVLVPTLEGKSLPEAVQALREAGLSLEKSGERSDEHLGAGKVLVQDPPGGVKLKRNRRVKVIVSLGMEVLQVPPMVGEPVRRAQIIIQQSGLQVGEISYAFHDQMGGDRILAQEPPPGSQRMRKGRVDLLISKGARQKVYVMPLVEGEDLAAVTRVFQEAGFRVGNVRRESAPGVRSGIVVRQYPPSGYPLRGGDPISLVVSAENEDNG